MVRLFILAALGVVIGLIVVKLISKKQGHDVIDGEGVDAKTEVGATSLLTILLLGMLLAGIVLFILPRFGISVMGLIQKALNFLPLIRGFLPF